MDRKQVDRAALTKPFNPDQIKVRQITRDGRTASYLSVSTVVERLNEAAPEWDFEVRKEWNDGNTTKALVRITIPGMGMREHVGVQELGGSQGADAIAKGAISDALKKAASLFGVGADLYDDSHGIHPQQGYQQQPQQGYQQPQQQQGYQQAPPQQMRPQQQPQQQQQQYPPQQQQGQYDNSAPKQYDPSRETGEMRTDPQAKKLGFELGDKNLGIHEAANHARVPINGGIDEVTKYQASCIIDWLTRQPSAPKDQAQGGGYGGGYQGQPAYDDSGMNDVPF